MKLFRTCLRSLTLLAATLGLLLPAVAASGAVAPQATYLSRITQEVRTPVRMASDQLGNLYVADPRSGGVQKYDYAGTFVARFPLKGARGIAVTPAGDLVVSRGDSVSVLNSTTGVEKFKLGAGAGQFRQATGVSVDDTGQIYVADSLDNCVQLFSSAGTPVMLATAAPGKPANSFGTGGNLPGQFSLPTGIAFEKVSRQLVVVDTLNSRLQFFSAAGTFQRSLGGPGVGPLQFSSPQAVAFEYSRGATPALTRLYVVDSFQGEVQVIDPAGTGSYLSTIGGYGVTPGKLAVPGDLLFDQATSRLVVANGLGNLTLYGINVTTTPVPDVTPPLLTLNPVPATTSASSVVLSGTVESEAAITITTDTGAVAGTVALTPQNGLTSFWTATLTGLVSGTNTITVVAKDLAANPTVLSAAIAYSPTAVKVAINPVVSPTNSSSQLLTGTRDSGATIALSSNTPALFGAVTYPTATTWQCSVTGLAAGDNAITATAGTSTSSSATTAVIALVTTPPDLNVSTLASGSVTSSPLLNVSGFIPVGAYFDKITLNGQPVTIMNDFFSGSLTLAAGSNAVVVKATDLAGNVATDRRTITYDPSRPAMTIDAPADGATVNGTTLSLSGTAAAGSTVTLLIYNGSANGTRFSQINQPGSGTAWSTALPLPLDPGINTIVAEVADLSGLTASSKVTITSDAKVPALAVSKPIHDIPVNTATQSVSGTVAPGATVTATITSSAGAITVAGKSVAAAVGAAGPASVSVPVALNADGTFTVPVVLTTEGTYTLAITATDQLGNAVTTYRSLVYDVTAPQISVTSTRPLKVTASEGTLTARDKNGPVSGAVLTYNANGSVTIDLTNATYDADTLDIQSVDGAGNSTRNGDIDGNGRVDIADGLKALRAAIGLDAATAEAKLRADVAPLTGGVSKPNGTIDIFDVVVIMEKIVGLR